MKQFDALDYILLVLVLGVSLLIGFHQVLKKYYLIIFRVCLKNDNKKVNVNEPKNNEENEACINKNINENVEKSKIKEYLIASASMSALPITLSLLATFFSANSILGYSVEVYLYGMQIWLFVFGIMITPLIGAFYTGPLFARLKVNSLFEYLKLRYNSEFVRFLTVLNYVLRTIISTALYIYGPATTLNYLASINSNVSILMIGSIGTLYTALGGIRAVIWTDVFQVFFMFAGLILIIIKGLVDIGGFGELFRINNLGGRLELFIFDPNPLLRQNFWSVIIGSAFSFFIYYCLDQQLLQRFAAAKNIRTAQIAVLLNIPGIFILLSMCCFCGMVVYAIYAKCDPLSIPGSKLTNINQILPYYVFDRLSSIYGAHGLFLASIFASALSSVSSAINSTAAILWGDFLTRFKYFNQMDDSKSTFTTKILVAICGILSTLLTFVIANVGGSVIQIGFSINGAFNSPIVGVFLLASLIPFSNKYGCILGITAGFSWGLILTFGSFFNKPIYPKLTVGTDCLNSTIISSNISSGSLHVQSPLHSEAINLVGSKRFFSLSYMLFTVTGVLVTLIVGTIVSLLTGCNKTNNHDQYLFECVRKLKKSKRAEKSNTLEQYDEKALKL